MFKKIITALVLLGLAAPGAGGAVVSQRPSVEACTLKHDLTDLFGGGFEIGEPITANPQGGKGAIKNLNALKASLATRQDTELLRDAAAIATERSANAVLNRMCSTIGFKNILGIECDDGLNVGEAKKIVNRLEWLFENTAIGDIPLVESAVSFIIGITLQIQPVTYMPDAALACLVDKIETAEDWFFIVFLVVAGVLFLYGAFIFLTAAGSPDKIKLARNLFIWGAVGLVVAFISKGLVNIIAQMMT